MNHPNEATLALYAGDDLGWIARRRTGRHLTRCERCRRKVDFYQTFREDALELNHIPNLPWNRLAAEMRANIRLGLAAGQCVGGGNAAPPERNSLFGTRALVSYASIAALVAASLLLERPAPRLAAQPEGVLLQATANGIQVKEGGRALTLMHDRSKDVTYSVGAQGALGGRYVDDGYVTINNVYAQ